MRIKIKNMEQTGCSAAVAHQSGGLAVAGSNPVTPNLAQSRFCWFVFEDFCKNSFSVVSCNSGKFE